MIKREIWHVTEGLLFAHLAVFLLTQSAPSQANVLVFYPQLILQRPWTVLSFQFLHNGMISFIFSMIILWIMGKTLEHEWGSLRFLVFWGISLFGATSAAFLLGQPLVGDVFLATSLLFTYATLNPDVEFLMFLVIPMKVKWLAMIGGGFLIYGSLRMGLYAGIANIIGMSAGYVFFLATRNISTKHKRTFERKKRQATRQVKAEASAAEVNNKAWDSRVQQIVERVRESHQLDSDAEGLLAELDEAVDSTVTVCAPSDFGYMKDPVCKACAGYAECAAQRIRLTSQGEA